MIEKLNKEDERELLKRAFSAALAGTVGLVVLVQVGMLQGIAACTLLAALHIYLWRGTYGFVDSKSRVNAQHSQNNI